MVKTTKLRVSTAGALDSCESGYDLSGNLSYFSSVAATKGLEHYRIDMFAKSMHRSVGHRKLSTLRMVAACRFKESVIESAGALMSFTAIFSIGVGFFFSTTFFLSAMSIPSPTA